MATNVGPIDKTIRLLLALALAVGAYFVSWWLLLPAAVLAGTALLNRCPAYVPFGLSTCATPEGGSGGATDA